MQVALLALLAQLLPLVRLPSVIRRWTALCADRPAAPLCADLLRLLQLLLPVCVRFSCCSRLRLLQLLPDCVRFGCCSLIASASTTAPRLRPFQLLFPDCMHLLVAPAGFQPMPGPNVLKHSSRSLRFSILKYESCVSLV